MSSNTRLSLSPTLRTLSYNSASAVDIFVSVHLSLLEASSVILRDPSHSDNASILFVLLELILVSLCSLHYTCFIPNR